MLQMCVLAPFGMAIAPWRSKAGAPGRVGCVLPKQERWELMALSPHRVPILATAVQEELEKEVLMEATPCNASAQVSHVPRTSRGTC